MQKDTLYHFPNDRVDWTFSGYIYSSPYGGHTQKGFNMAKFQIIEDAKRQARGIFVGMAIPCQPSVADGVYTPIRGEKVLKFAKATRKGGRVKVKADPRHKGGDDLMIVKVGKPGSRERVEALANQYAAILADGCEVSPFAE